MDAPTVTIVATLAALTVLTLSAHILLRRQDTFARAAGPMLAGLIGAFGLVLPAFWIYEPRHAGERIGLLLPALAMVGAALLLVWTCRAARMVIASRRVTRAWMLHGSRIAGGEWGIDAIEVDTGDPLVAVAGILRPRLFIDRRVLNCCTASELSAIAAHERAHVQRRDNLRRLLVTACSGASSRRAAEWRHASELDADRRAADSPLAALELAGALLKISRADRMSFDTMLLSAIQDAAPLEARIRELLRPAPAVSHQRQASGRWLAAVLFLPLAPAVLQRLHHVLEIAVRHLP